MNEFNLKKERSYMTKFGLFYFMGTLLAFGVQYGANILLVYFFPQVAENTSMVFLAMMVPLFVVVYPIMMLLISRLEKCSIQKHKMTVGQFILAFIMCYAIMYVSNLFGTIITWVIGLLKGTPVNNALLDVIGNIHPALTVIFAVVLAPIFEELIFRKLLIDRMVRYGEAVAILMSGLMFGLFHGNLNQFMYAFCLGCFFGFIYVKTGRIHYTMILHFMINFMGSVMGLLVLNIIPLDEITNAQSQEEMMRLVVEYSIPLLIYMGYVLFILALTITGIVLCIVYRKRFRCSHTGIVAIPKGKAFQTLLLNWGMGVFILFWMVQIVLQLFQ